VCSQVTECQSTKLCHMFGSGPELKMHMENLGVHSSDRHCQVFLVVTLKHMLDNLSHRPNLPNFFKNWLLFCLGGALFAWGCTYNFPLLISPPIFFSALGCMNTQCTPLAMPMPPTSVGPKNCLFFGGFTTSQLTSKHKYLHTERH